VLRAETRRVTILHRRILDAADQGTHESLVAGQVGSPSEAGAMQRFPSVTITCSLIGIEFSWPQWTCPEVPESQGWPFHIVCHVWFGAAAWGWVIRLPAATLPP
jgi:hypothetical protein